MEVLRHGSSSFYTTREDQLAIEQYVQTGLVNAAHARQVTGWHRVCLIIALNTQESISH